MNLKVLIDGTLTILEHIITIPTGGKNQPPILNLTFNKRFKLGPNHVSIVSRCHWSLPLFIVPVLH